MLAYELFESDAEHAAALEKTGFWGKQAAGCIFLARDTGRYLIAHRSPYVQEPNTWGRGSRAIGGCFARARRAFAVTRVFQRGLQTRGRGRR